MKNSFVFVNSEERDRHGLKSIFLEIFSNKVVAEPGSSNVPFPEVIEPWFYCSCAPHSISKVLDRLKIRPDHSVDFRAPTLPTPGKHLTFITQKTRKTLYSIIQYIELCNCPFLRIVWLICFNIFQHFFLN